MHTCLEHHWPNLLGQNKIGLDPTHLFELGRNPVFGLGQELGPPHLLTYFQLGQNEGPTYLLTYLWVIVDLTVDLSLDAGKARAFPWNARAFFLKCTCSCMKCTCISWNARAFPWNARALREMHVHFKHAFPWNARAFRGNARAFPLLCSCSSNSQPIGMDLFVDLTWIRSEFLQTMSTTKLFKMGWYQPQN